MVKRTGRFLIAAEIETRNPSGPIYQVSAKKVFSRPDFTAGKSSFVAVHLRSNERISQHNAGYYWSV